VNPSKKSKNSSKSKYLGYFLIGISALILYFQFVDTPDENNADVKQNADLKTFEGDPHQIVDQHLKEAQHNIYNKKEQIQFQKDQDDQLDFEEFGTGTHLEKNPIPLELNSSEIGEKLSQDLNKNMALYKGKPTSPDELLQMELFNASEQNKLDEAYKEAYAKHFIENARRDGWEIKLNKNYKIISAKPILKPN